MTETVELPTDAVGDVIKELETGMRQGENHMKADKIRPSGYMMAESHRQAYKTLIEAHPEYELTKDGESND